MLILFSKFPWLKAPSMYFTYSLTVTLHSYGLSSIPDGSKFTITENNKTFCSIMSPEFQMVLLICYIVMDILMNPSKTHKKS